MPIPAKTTLDRLMSEFDTDAECRTALEKLRWPDGVCCLRCGSTSISRITTRKQFDCNACRYRFSVTTGTVFNDSHLPLPKWFMAVLLLCEAKKGMSANQLMRTLGVAKKTAWYLNHRIRAAMTEANPKPLTGTVECDETYIGGKHRAGSADGRKTWRRKKATVLGALERGGDIRLKVSRDAEHGTLKSFINECAPNPSRIFTDGHYGYRGIGDHDTIHESVDHRAHEYVRGDVHTNSIESAFGLFKRAIVGSFHQVSHKHLDRYLDEFEFRFNNRKNPYLFRDTLMRLVRTEAMPYEKLTAPSVA
jgi:transposase-like protein